MGREVGDRSDRAACAGEDPELFFPVGQKRGAFRQIEQARAVCERCGIRGDCLGLALSTTAEYGIWGGYTPQERRRIGRRLARASS